MSVNEKNKQRPIAGAIELSPSVARRNPGSAPKRHRASNPDDFKTSMLNIRVRDDLKTDATNALERIGISLPEAVRVFLGRIVREQAFPFPLEAPNPETADALRESSVAKRKRFASAKDMFDALEDGDVA